MRAARGNCRGVFRRLDAQLVRGGTGCARLGRVEERVAGLGDVVGDRLLIGVVQRNADVDAVPGVRELDLARAAGIAALEVGAVILWGRNRQPRGNEHGGNQDGHGLAESTHGYYLLANAEICRDHRLTCNSQAKWAC
ncbi:hypothetical protein FZI93_14805 [Mycobacterium sp. CBMA361]|nr:hypothetical protein [Mycolicibacterium sp. CBMA 361]